MEEHIAMMDLSEQDRRVFWGRQFDMDQLYTVLLFLFPLRSNINPFGIYSEEAAGAPCLHYTCSWFVAACEVIFEYNVPLTIV